MEFWMDQINKQFKLIHTFILNYIKDTSVITSVTDKVDRTASAVFYNSTMYDKIENNC